MINEKQARKEVKRLEKELIAMILVMIPEFSTDGMRLKLDAKNMQLADLNQLFKKFNRDFQASFLVSIFNQIKGFKKILDNYYRSLGFKTFTVSHKKIGIFNKSIFNYMNKFALSEQVRMEIQGYLISGIASNITPQALSKGVKNAVKLQKYYNQYMWEEIAQMERIQNNFYAEELELNWFIYEGGLIETSRQFCIKRDGKLFNRSDASKWRFDPTLPQPETADTYQPLVELGRWNCRHSLRWITDEQAKEI